MNDVFQKILFPDGDENTFAIIDGASCEGLLGQLTTHDPEHACLYTGDLGPDLLECAPYLVALEPDHPFTDWLLDDSFGKHWGIFARSSESLRTLRKHFRTFLVVKIPEGKRVYFRYYDPRVLQMYLPTCSTPEIQKLFGPVKSYIFEHVKAQTMLRFSFDRAGVNHESFPYVA